jgi:murein DD-endopeptidase MepM/ murein hydrolase activator NlpD
MRHILLAVAAIGAVSAVALSVSSKPIADPGNHFNTLPTSYSSPDSGDPGLPKRPSTRLAGSAVPASGGPEALSTAAGEAVESNRESTPESAGESYAESSAARERIEHVRRGDTLITLLTRAGVSAGDAHGAAQALRPVFNPRALKIGQEVKLTFVPSADVARDGLNSLALQASVERDVAVRRTQAGDFRPQQTGRALRQSLGRAGAMIDSSLFKAGTGAGVPVEIMFELIRAFSYDVDFQRDIQPGDSFEVVFEQTHDATGRLVRTGHMIYGALSLSGNLLELYRYAPRDGGPPDYFNAKGESVKKALLRTPVDGAKLTSSYGMRNHPILGYSRMHRGVDFGAPAGTPIMAAGDGVIDMAGLNGEYGNYVRIRHNDSYSTAYAHMSRVAPGLHRGTAVHQGQIIGFVGATGLATGPHLHYEVLAHDHQINPMSVKVPSGRQLAGAELRRFNTAIVETEHEIRRLPDPFAVADTAR